VLTTTKNRNRNDLRRSHHVAGRRRGIAFSFVDGVFLHLCVCRAVTKKKKKKRSQFEAAGKAAQPK
jgi:hypothetical protein